MSSSPRSSSPRSSSPRTKTYKKQIKTGFVSKGEKYGDNQYLSFHRAVREIKPEIHVNYIEEDAPETQPFTNWKEATNYKSESSLSPQSELEKLEEVDAQIQNHDMISKDVLNEHSATLKHFGKKIKGMKIKGMKDKYNLFKQNYNAIKENHIEYWKLNVTPGGKTRKSRSK
jgi:hypothetical protein